MRIHIVIGALVTLGLIGCASDDAARLTPPDDWQAEGTRWWKAGVDTTGLFRNLETLDAMGVDDGQVTYVADASRRQASTEVHDQFEQAVKRSLIRLYRNRPAVVDSLFEAYVQDKMAEVTFTDDPVADVETFKRRAYKLLARHFREPRTRLELGQDVPIAYPDSLRANGVKGQVHLQAYLNEEGAPLTVHVIEGLHPVLDAIALNATTAMRWQPAYIESKGKWKPIESWARFRVTFQVADS